MSAPWNIRTTANPLVRTVGRGLTRLNDRHPWNHNTHFHPWILRSLPRAPERVLDVGCGRGELVATLTGHAAEVHGIDPDQEMAYAAATALRDHPEVHLWRRSLAEHAAMPEHAGTYEAITMVASLHHLRLDQALPQLRDLLAPGGRLLVVTLARPEGALDQLWDVTNVLTNPLIGLIRHPRPVREPTPPVRMPVRDASFSLATLREQAGLHLPGPVTIRRRTGFRATLRWQSPAPPSAGDLSAGDLSAGDAAR